MIEKLKLFSKSSGPILITGHTGFKGTWLTLLLEQLGIQAIGYSLPGDPDSLFTLLNRKGKIEEKFSDIRDFKLLGDFIQANKPSAIIHMAAQPLVIDSYLDPMNTFTTNVLGTGNVLEIARKHKAIRSVLIVTTDKVYKHSHQFDGFKENDPLEGGDPYAASKVGTESVASLWRHISRSESGAQIITVRAGNVVGGGDRAKNRLLPDLMHGITNSNRVTIRNPKYSRPWQHALDPLFGYLLALQFSLQSESGESFNFGPLERSLTVRNVVDQIQTLSGNKLLINYSEPSATFQESERLELDSSKALNILNWKPVWTQELAIDATFNWWKRVSMGEMSPLDATLSDIEHLIDTRLRK